MGPKKARAVGAARMREAREEDQESVGSQQSQSQRFGGGRVMTPFKRPGGSKASSQQASRAASPPSPASPPAPASPREEAPAKRIGLGRGKKMGVGRSRKAIKKSRDPSKPRRKAKNFNHFGFHLMKVLKQVHPECGISTKAMTIMNSFMTDIFEKIAREASTLMKYNKTVTLTSRDVQSACRLLLPGELAKHAVSEGTKAVTKYTQARN